MKGNDLRETGGSSAGELEGVEAAINVLYKIRIKTPVEIKKKWLCYQSQSIFSIEFSLESLNILHSYRNKVLELIGKHKT